MEIQMNYLAVLVAGIVAMVVGFLWYSPILNIAHQLVSLLAMALVLVLWP